MHMFPDIEYFKSSAQVETKLRNVFEFSLSRLLLSVLQAV